MSLIFCLAILWSGKLITCFSPTFAFLSPSECCCITICTKKPYLVFIFLWACKKCQQLGHEALWLCSSLGCLVFWSNFFYASLSSIHYIQFPGVHSFIWFNFHWVHLTQGLKLVPSCLSGTFFLGIHSHLRQLALRASRVSAASPPLPAFRLRLDH